MTRNNLQSHLAWLLHNKAVPPQGGVQLPTPASLSSALEILDAVVESNFVQQEISLITPPTESFQGRPPHQPIHAETSVSTRPSGSRPPQTTPAPEQHTIATIMPGSESTPRSVAKIKDACRRPLVSSSTTPTSLTASYTAQLRESAALSQASDYRCDASIAPHLPKTPRSATNGARAAANITTPHEVLDLTSELGSSQLASSISSGDESHGETRRIRREDSASRPEVSTKRGTKRKSDGSTRGKKSKRQSLEQKATPYRNAQDAESNDEAYVDIDDFDPHMKEDDLIDGQSSLHSKLHATVGGTYPNKDSDILKNASEAEDESLLIESIPKAQSSSASRALLGAKPTEKCVDPSSLFVSPRADMPSTPRTKGLNPLPNGYNATSPTKIKCTPMRAPYSVQRTPTSKVVIDDSEDGEMMSPADRKEDHSRRVDTQMSPLRKQQDILKATKHAIEHTWRTTIPDPPPKQSWSSPKLAERHGYSPLIAKVNSVPSSFQQKSLSSTEEGLSNKEPKMTPTDDASEKKKLLYFLQNPSCVLSRHQKLNATFADLGQLCLRLLDDQHPDLQSVSVRRKECAAQLQALDGLSNLRERHRQILQEKKNIIMMMSQGLESCEDVSHYESEIPLLSRALKKVESEMIQNLRVSGALEEDWDEIIESRGAPARVQNHGRKNPENVARSTLSNCASRSDTEVSSDVSDAQIIQQTQFPPSVRSAVQQVKAHGPNFRKSWTERDASHPSQDHVKHETGYQASPSTLNGSTLLSISRSTEAPSVLRERGRRKLSPQLRVSQAPPLGQVSGYGNGTCEGVLNGEEDEPFIRGSSTSYQRNQPPQYAAEDEFGELSDIDDAEMLEATRNAETRQLPSARKQSTPRRVFSETSGNIPGPYKPPPPDTVVEKDQMLPTHAPRADMMKHVWSHDVKRVLKDNFRLRGFRHNQLEAVNATLSGKDAFVLMPTGGGKSLCYQLPAIVQSGKTRGITIVISPLLSLMQDQVEHLKKLGVQAFLINGEVTPEYRNMVMAKLREDNPEMFIQLLYVTPEMINKSTALLNAFSNLHLNRKLARIVIDEAHCVSEWGHDFRPDYKTLGVIRQERFKGVPIMALTATATENVKIDVMHNLSITKCEVFTQSFNRPNLTYEVRIKESPVRTMESIANTILTVYKGKTGIIYALSRKNCETIAKKLRDEYKIKAEHYHAGLEPEQKAAVQKGWQSGKMQVIVATIAFGMGIDKPDVRFVIHHAIPKSLEGYYQETGRAGRDGKRSGCFLYFGIQDAIIMDRLIDGSQDGSKEQKDRQRKMLNMVVRFCTNRHQCRRVQVLEYFGEAIAREDCRGTCDNCTSNRTFELVDRTDVARNALSLTEKLQNRKLTIAACAEILRGSRCKRLESWNAQACEEFGSMKHIPRMEIDELLYQLRSENALSEENVTNGAGFASQYLRLGPAWRDFMSKRRRLKIHVETNADQSKHSAVKSKSRATVRSAAQHGADDDLDPQSTLVTSPIRSSSKRKTKKQTANPQPIERMLGQRGHSRDNFVVSDNDDDTDDAFEPVREAGRRRAPPKNKRPLGPPITNDQRLSEASVNEIHREVIHSFVGEAKRLEERIRNERNLRKPLFTESNFREMAINWTTTAREMAEIPDINVEKVELFGARFVPLVRRYHDSYSAMMDRQDDRDIDQNHQNVIDLISDNEDIVGDDDLIDSDVESEEAAYAAAAAAAGGADSDDYGDVDDEDLAAAAFADETAASQQQQQQRSKYYQRPNEVEAFNEVISQTQMYARRPAAGSPSQRRPATGAKGGKWSARKSFARGGGAAAKRRSGGGVAKRSSSSAAASTARRASGGGSGGVGGGGFGKSAGRIQSRGGDGGAGGGGGRSGGGGGGGMLGIGIMPT